MVKGECNCGMVSFEISTEVSDVYICHCSICRRATGSGGIAVSVVPSNKFKWLMDTSCISSWRKPGHDWQTSFCASCGSPVPGINDEYHMYIPVSLLTQGDENLTVKHHLFVGSKASWDVISDTGEQHNDGINNG